MDTQTATGSGETATDGWEWARVEIMGHRTHYGRGGEEERFGSKMIRIDIPTKGDPAPNGWKTVFYGGSSIFSFAPTDEVTVMQANRPYEPTSRLTYRHADDDSDIDETA
jgi:hypothetical protein